jgi:hypothetical protein
MAENIVKNEVLNHGEGVTEVTNWISQINAGGTVYDIATHHGITFKDGKNDGTGVKWHGLTDLEIVIPSITDIVQTPIEFAGTVGEGGKITWTDGHTTAEKGNLVFVTVDCEFAGKACEAGDMAIFDGTKWNIVSGENQVKIVGSTQDTIDAANRTVVAVGSAKDVLVVEGKALSLTLDYNDLNQHVECEKEVETVSVQHDFAVNSTYVKIVKGEGTKKEIGDNVNIQQATKLADGTVTLNEEVVTDIDFGTFNPGSLYTVEKNSKKDLTIAGGSLSSTTGLSDGGVFVDSVTIDGTVKFENADSNDQNKITAITNISVVTDSGKEFLSGIKTVEKQQDAVFTIKGLIKPEDGAGVKFIKGLEGDIDTVVTSITEGTFKLVEGTDLATGFGAEQDGKGGEVLSDVTVTANNDTSVLSQATVENHVLTFGSTNVASGVSVSYKSRSLEKKGFEYTSSVASSAKFVTGGFTQESDTHYAFDKGYETSYTYNSGSWKVSTPTIKVTKGTYSLNTDDMVAHIDADMFVTDLTGGALPSFTTNPSFTKTNVSGSVSTVLSYTDVTIHTLKAGINEIEFPEYSLETGSEGDGVKLVLLVNF